MIPHFYQTIQGWDAGIPELYKKMVDSAPSSINSHFVEVGTWKGRSAAFMAVEISNSGKKIKFECVDTWQGTIDDGHLEDHHVKNGTLYEHFIQNMLPVKDFYTPIIKSSIEAAHSYKDNSLDFVFIDAAHDYENVKADINAWLSKVKVDGILAGHDMFHPPVAKAVNEMLKTASRFNKQCWIYKKER
jgi:predicted O-methyltransferase YrrM